MDYTNKTKDYSDAGMTPQLNDPKSLMNTRIKKVVGPTFNMAYQVQSDRVNTSKINVESFIVKSEYGSATGSFAAGSVLPFSTTLSYVTPNVKYKMFAIPYIAIYEGTGTIAANQIYPVTGGSVTYGRYRVQCDFDLATWDEVKSNFRGNIIDTNGTSTQTVTLLTKWWHPDYRTGENV